MIEIETRNFVQAMDIAGSVLRRGSPIQVLRQLRLHANGSLAVAGTDLDVACEVKLPYSGEPQPPFMLPEPGYIRKAVGHAGAGTVRLEPVRGDYEALKVTAGDLSLDAGTRTSASDFPEHDVQGFAHEMLSCVLGAGEIAALARVARGISTEETRYYLNGIYLHLVDDWTLRAVATDGHRLFWANLKVPGAKIHRDSFRPVILYRGLIQRVLARFRRCDEVALVIGSPAVANSPSSAEGTAPAPNVVPRSAFGAVLGSLAVTFRGKTIDGTYPDYQRVIPVRHDHRVIVDVVAMRRAMQALTVGSGWKAPNIRFVVDGKSLLCSINAQWGEEVNALQMRVPLLDGSAVTDKYQIGLNGRYLLDCLDACRGERLTMGLSGSGDPVSLADDVDADFGMVLMPVRV
ncbi:Beta sliding clamp [Sphingomonas sp. S2M10]|uniref:DNA polymerase III subunit beta family protein n=1 Tax=Sphingomonas sp. S2M10 TaxID=2705010 RepID=UPI001456D10F|nr:hypothetical protein [Sphingomonas sp. S2M10]NLS25724.1 Beta sliding clamp [Sphingomonas sp. S2M10]